MAEIRTVTTLIAKRDQIEAAIANCEARLEQARSRPRAHQCGDFDIRGRRPRFDDGLHGHSPAVSARRDDGHLPGRAGAARAYEHAGAGGAYLEGEGTGQRRPCAGEVRRRTADQDASEAREGSGRGEGARGGSMAVVAPSFESNLIPNGLCHLLVPPGK